MNPSTMKTAFAAGGLLLLGLTDGAQADHGRSSVDITIATPGIYTRFATGPRYSYPVYAPGGYYAWAPPPVPVYVPGYWTYQPPPGHWQVRHEYRNDHRNDHRHDHRGPRHHRDRDRHGGGRHDHDD